ncbi:MAG: prepilin-type N-terminal cleavage/methylation domain-containing protein [Phycisphaerales bacterium]
MRNQVRKAFTLVEILIVVVILGILAAIVIPQFTSATQDAQGGNIKAQLQTLQSQIELYRARNNNTDPDFTNLAWNDLRGLDAQGAAIANAEQYIKKDPVNPAVPANAGFGNTTVVVSSTATDHGSAAAAWVWNTSDNTLYASYFDEVAGKVTDTATD